MQTPSLQTSIVKSKLYRQYVKGKYSRYNKEYDNIRDQALSNLGYTTIRIPTSDLSTDTIDNYLQQLY